MFLQIYLRIRSLLFAAFFVAIGHSLLSILLPLSLSEQGVPITIIGLAMSSFAIGQIIATIYGNKIIMKVGHIRIYANVAAVMAIIAILHSYINHLVFVFIGRVIVGACITIIFVTLESWLNSTSDKSNRASIFSIFQILFGGGYAAAPFLFNFIDIEKNGFFALAALVVCISLLPLTLTYRVTPQLQENWQNMKIKRLFAVSPSGTITTFIGGLMAGPILTLNPIYVNHLGVSGIVLTLLFASNQLGSLFTQFPVGLLADRFDKRSIVAGLMVICAIANLGIIIHNFTPVNNIMLIILFLLSYGIIMCMYPLAVTQVFDSIDTDDAIPATSTLVLVFALGYLVGPILASNAMNIFGNGALFGFLIVCNITLFSAMIIRRLFINPAVEEDPSKFKAIITADNLPKSDFDPRNEYSFSEINSSAIAILTEALKQGVQDPKKLIATTFEYVKYEPYQVASNLVYYLPRQSEEIMRAFVELYPAERIAIAIGLHDIFILNKTRINTLVTKGLLYNATNEEKQVIREMLQDIEEEVNIM